MEWMAATVPRMVIGYQATAKFSVSQACTVAAICPSTPFALQTTNLKQIHLQYYSYFKLILQRQECKTKTTLDAEIQFTTQTCLQQ